MSSIRVLHISEILPGGTATYLQELWSHQREQLGQAQVRFLLPGPQLEHAPDLPAHLVTGWPREGRDLRSLARLGTAINKEIAAFRPDIVHIHGTFGGVVGRIVLSARAKRPKIVYCSHGWSFAMDVSPLKKRLYAGLERTLSRASDAIITISDDERRLAVEAGLPPDKLLTISNGILEAPQGAGVSRPSEGPIRLLFAGRHDRQKGLDILLAAMTKLGDMPVELDVLGEPLGEDGRALGKGDASTARAGGRVNYIGWVPRQEVARRMAAADAFVMPSRWEGFGLVAVEAMREGTPVIASDRGALPEIIDHGRTGLIFKLDPEALADCLRQISRPQLRALGAEARSEFERRFTSHRMSEDILALYQRLTG